jgi:Holliday junction resolvase RusA-like endonuclease
MNEIVAAAKSGRGKGNAYSRQKALWTAVVARHARSRRIGHLASPVSVYCVWHEATRRRDPDNVQAAVKFILDGLVEAGVLAGDRWTDIQSVSHALVVSSTPGVAVTIETRDAP